jgi:hypothetical protein
MRGAFGLNGEGTPGILGQWGGNVGGKVGVGRGIHGSGIRSPPQPIFLMLILMPAPQTFGPPGHHCFGGSGWGCGLGAWALAPA